MMMKCFARGATQVTSDVQAKKEEQDQKNQKNKKGVLNTALHFQRNVLVHGSSIKSSLNY